MVAAAQATFDGLPDDAYQAIASYLPFGQRVQASTLSRPMRRSFVRGITRLVLGASSGVHLEEDAAASLRGLLSSMEGLEELVLPFSPPIFEKLWLVLRANIGAQIQVIRCSYAPEDAAIADYCRLRVEGLPSCLAALPCLRVLEVGLGRGHLTAGQAADLLRSCGSPGLEEVRIRGLTKQGRDLEVLGLALTGRASRGCRPLRSCKLWLLPYGADKDEALRGLAELLGSPALAELEALVLENRYERNVVTMADADLLCLCDYLARRGPGELKELRFVIGGCEGARLPEPSLAALRRGALRGLEGDGLGRHLAFALITQPEALRALAEGGGCHKLTSLTFLDGNREWCYPIVPAVESGAFRGLESLTLELPTSKDLATLAAALTDHKLPCLRELVISSLSLYNRETPGEALAPLVDAAASGALSGLRSLDIWGLHVRPMASAEVASLLIQAASL
jgi:hypothetical protein